MKKMTILLALVAITATLAGCTKDNTEGTVTSTSTSAVVGDSTMVVEDTDENASSEGTPKKKPAGSQVATDDDIDPLSDDINHHEYVESSERDNDEIDGN